MRKHNKNQKENYSDNLLKCMNTHECMQKGVHSIPTKIRKLHQDQQNVMSLEANFNRESKLPRQLIIIHIRYKFMFHKCLCTRNFRFFHWCTHAWYMNTLLTALTFWL